jgi:hypothetical protein
MERHDPARLPTSDTVSRRPAEACHGLAEWTILTPYPTAELQLVDQIEQVRIVDFTPARFVTSGYACDLEVLDVADVPGNRIGEVSFRELHVVDVKMEMKVVIAYRLDRS